MGLIPGRGGFTLPEMLSPNSVDVLWIVGANPLDRHHFAKGDRFLVVQDLFMTTTAAEADRLLEGHVQIEVFRVVGKLRDRGEPQ